MLTYDITNAGIGEKKLSTEELKIKAKPRSSSRKSENE